MDEIKALVRTHDYERYICSLFVKPPYRDYVWAVLALGYEVMRIPATVSEPMVGMVRLKWWQENIQHLAQKSGQGRRDHPVLQALIAPLEQGIIDVSVCDMLCDALAEQCGEAISFESASNVMASLYQLMAQASGCKGEQDAFATLGKEAALIATIRTKCLKSGNIGDAEPLLEMLDMSEHASTTTTSTFCRKLARHNRLWHGRIEKAVSREKVSFLKHIPLFPMILSFRA